jgi:hypothetical protein
MLVVIYHVSPKTHDGHTRYTWTRGEDRYVDPSHAETLMKIRAGEKMCHLLLIAITMAIL